MVIDDTLIRSLDDTPKIMGKFFKMLKIGYGEYFKMSERISTPGSNFQKIFSLLPRFATTKSIWPAVNKGCQGQLTDLKIVSNFS